MEQRSISPHVTGPWSHRFCTAPMMEWSDRHCRYFFRQLSRHARLYTEMVTTGALLHGDVPRHLRFHPDEQPVALQLGGSEPDELARCAEFAERWGYDEVNLNCGCPSERVQRGAFGACLMAEPELVADCVRAMRAACGIPVTVKHRLGIDRNEDYGFARRFVEANAAAGCDTFIVHARNAWLQGLSPKDNREVPPLRYAEVHRLKREFPQLRIILNGGLADWDAAERELAITDGALDGVMLGRAAYHDSYLLADVDRRLYDARAVAPTRRAVVEAMLPYVAAEIAAGTHLRAITRHMLGLFHGQPGARRWRRHMSDAKVLAANHPDILLQALELAEGGSRAAIAA